MRIRSILPSTLAALMIFSAASAQAQQASSLDLTPNPEIERLAKAVQEGEPLVPMKGFIGAASPNDVRLYTSMSLSTWVDLPKSAVVSVTRAGEGTSGPSTLFVRPNATASFGHRDTAATFSSSLSGGALQRALSTTPGGGAVATRAFCTKTFLLPCLLSPALCASYAGCLIAQDISTDS